MADIGFYHPERGYWQAIEPVQSVEELLNIYPEGTKVVPLKPGADFEFVDNAWIEVEPPPPTAADVDAERDRRLSAGFDYDFGDARGVQEIGTTEADMRRWLDEVTPIAQAFINAGLPTGEIAIKTNTAAVAITAAEWQQILLAAGQWRQPIYQASFVLKAMHPIPADFADNSFWP